MKKLLNVNKGFYILIFILIIIFITFIIVAFNFKIEKSQSFILEVDSSGETKIMVEPQILRKLKQAKIIYANIEDIQNQVTLGEINFKPQENYWIVNLKGISNLFPGEKLKISLIYGYESLFKSFISSGV